MPKLTLNQLKEKFIGKKGTTQRIKFEADVKEVLAKAEEKELFELKAIPDSLMPSKVYKYSEWDNLEAHTKSLISEREVYMANPAEFYADYPECRLPRRYDLLEDKDAFVKCYILHEIAADKLPEPRLKHNFIELLKTARKGLSNHAEAEMKFYKKRYNGFGIFCTCESKDSVYMWEKRGDFFQGYCVGFNTTELLKYENFLGICGVINYYDTNNVPIILPIYPFFKDENYGAKSIITEIFSIPLTYKEEKEYRFFKTNSVNGKMCDYTLAERRKVLPESAFSEIIVGYAMRREDREELIKHASSTMPNVPIFEARYLNPNVEFTQIK